MTRYVNAKALSKYTSLPVQTIYEWARKGKFPCSRIGRRMLFDLQEIDKIMDLNKHYADQHETTPVEIVGGVVGDSL